MNYIRHNKMYLFNVVLNNHLCISQRMNVSTNNIRYDTYITLAIIN